MRRTPRRGIRLADRAKISSCQRSSALVIVLGCLAIITVLIVALLSTVSTERQSAQFYANGSSVKLLADSTVSIVMGQIKDATKGVDSSGGMLSWASQPGMIRTYNTAGQPSSYYKLYSWANMVGAGSFTSSSTSETPPSTWASMPALYTDLNDPVSGIYPIVDPAAINSVQGFSITGAPTSSTDSAPMPVQWLYVLQDGSVATATGSAGNSATVAAASVYNPIVGRIAFWADDDTCKININTAAGDVWTTSSSAPAPGQPGNPGSFWDIPRTANQTFELAILSKNQPAQSEYQRYPGHPATTYLSAVFPSLSPTSIYQIIPRVAPGGSYSGTTVAATNVIPDSDRLYSSIDELLFNTNRVNQPTLPSGATALAPQAIEQAKFFLTAHSRAPEVNLYNRPRVVIWPVSVRNDNTHRTAYDSLIAYCGSIVATNSVSGVLTTNAYYFQRNIENAVGAATTTGADSATDDLPAIATATGLGRNRSLITYLRNQTSLAVPGFSTSGETFLSKYPLDRDEILTEIFDYIRAANSQDSSSPVAGFVPYTITSASQTGITGQGQIVPIIDNVHSDSNAKTLRGFGRFPTVREAGLLFTGVGQVQGAITNAMPVGNPNYTATPIPDGNTRVQATFYLNFFDPSMGYASAIPNYKVRVSQLNGFTWGGTGMGFTSAATASIVKGYLTGNYGGYKGASTFMGAIVPTTSNGTTFTAGIPGFFSTPKDFPTTSSTNTTTFPFVGGDLKVEILDDSSAGNVLQTLTMNFPSASFPVPSLAPQLQDWSSGTSATNDYRSLTAYSGTFPSNIEPIIGGRFTGAAGANAASVSTSTKMWMCGKDVVRSVVANTDPRLIAAQANVPASLFSEMEPQYSDPTVGQIHGLAEAENGGGLYFYQGAMPGKLVANANYGGIIGAGTPTPWTGSDYYYSGATYPASSGLQPIASWVNSGGTNNTHGGIATPSMPFAYGMTGGQCTGVNGVTVGSNQNSNTTNYTSATAPPGDWDSGSGNIADGAFVNKVDEGEIAGITNSGVYPYFNNQAVYVKVGGTFFSPNRQISSPVTFGSLPTGVESNKPWQTLLFRPDPGGTPQHIGAQSPQDHLLLDLFNMPVVEPYAISDPFSTAGKINMNYQIVPFTYISRSTGIQAVLKPEQILALSSANGTTVAGDAWNYKGNMNFANHRNFIDLTQTLVGFQNRFSSGDIFRSASEICNIWLVPQGQTYTGMQTYWQGNLLTGDNIRERPYSDLYPRLTTKSNTFTVHYRAQMLTKVKSTQVNQWVEGTDVVSAEYRGSSTLERYLDTSDNSIPDYATEALPLGTAKAIDNFYKFRVIETKQFTP